ncbi:MAG: hemoglobin [Sulfurimonas sp.]|jgi:hemoglobin|uniref:group III truncated hemoglobin n=1 Tax=Sulfurimonas sp. TaxID=2022749 RepID=UPI0039E49147
MQDQTITRKNIRSMMDRFYSQVLKDEIVADFFIDKLGDEMISDEWQGHLDLLSDFWASTILSETSYKGQPVKPHIHMEGLQRVTFERWLELFFETVDKYYTKESADIFKTRSQSIANNFMRVLGI